MAMARPPPGVSKGNGAAAEGEADGNGAADDNGAANDKRRRQWQRPRTLSR